MTWTPPSTSAERRSGHEVHDRSTGTQRTGYGRYFRVLTTRCPGNDEVIVDDDNALTWGVGDVDEGASDLHHLLSAPDLRARLGAEGRACAQQFSVDAMIARYRNVYQQFTSTSSRKSVSAP